MNKLIARCVTVATFTVLLLAGTSYGQYVQRIITVNAPFDFTVNGKNVAAGEYSIVIFAPNRLALRDANGRYVASLLAHSVESRRADSTTRLEFSTAQGGYALSQIWIAGEPLGYELASPKPNTLVAKRLSRASDHASGAGNK